MTAPEPLEILGERWLPIPEWEGLYSISDHGRIKSHARKTVSKWGTPLAVRERIMKLSPDSDGYLFTYLTRLGRRERAKAHRLVLEVFVGPKPFEDAQACHGDGNRANNRLDNLRWGSRSDNVLDSVRHGTHSMTRRTHCPKGHEYDEANTLYRSGSRPGSRICRTCLAAYKRALKAKQKVARS